MIVENKMVTRMNLIKGLFYYFYFCFESKDFFSFSV